jgi:hypothetical protein
MNSRRIILLTLVVLVIAASTSEAISKSGKQLAKKPKFNILEIIELINKVSEGFQAWWKLHKLLFELVKPLVAFANKMAPQS